MKRDFFQNSLQLTGLIEHRLNLLKMRFFFHFLRVGSPNLPPKPPIPEHRAVERGVDGGKYTWLYAAPGFFWLMTVMTITFRARLRVISLGPAKVRTRRPCLNMLNTNHQNIFNCQVFSLPPVFWVWIVSYYELFRDGAIVPRASLQVRYLPFL